jgi:glycosyltransferase involved in cell wall biosynthesis
MTTQKQRIPTQMPHLGAQQPTDNDAASPIPAVSIIVTCFNYGKYLNDALRSVIQQTFESWECIIVDDGSTDDSRDIAAAWIDKDRRFKYLYQDNLGLSCARNAGLKQARGRYIQILDADDMLEADKLLRHVTIMERSTDDTSVYSTYVKQAELGSETWNEHVSEETLRPRKDWTTSLVWEWERYLSIPPHCFMHRRSNITAIGGFDVNLVTHEDFDLLHRLVISGGTFIFDNRALVIYRTHEGSMCSDRFQMADGYLHALGLALQRSKAKRLKLLTLIRYIMECEGFVTLSFMKLQCRQAVGCLWRSQYALLTLLSLTLYPCVFIMRLPKRLIRRAYKKQDTHNTVRF